MAKKSRQTTEPPARPGGHRIYVPSIGQRLRDVMRHLVLAEGTLASDHDKRAFEIYDYAEAAREAIVAAHEEIYWLTELPADILAQHAPDDEQKKEIEAGAEPPDRDGAR